MNYRPVYYYYGENFANCLWFDEDRYWRSGDCELVGTNGNFNTDRISMRDLRCPINKGK